MPRPLRYTGAPILVRPTQEVRAQVDDLARASGLAPAVVARIALELGLDAARAQLLTDTDPGEGS